MLSAAITFALAAITSAVLTPLVRDSAVRRGALDHAWSSRKVHARPVPRLGGVAIVAAFWLPLVALYFVNSVVGGMFWARPEAVAGLFAGGLAIAALGVYDDLKGADARKKFAVQFAVGALMYALGFRIDSVTNPFGDPVALGLLGLPVTMLWFAGMVNAMNLIDGLDGLAGGVAFIGLGSTFALAALGGDPLMMLFSAALAGAVLGFLFYNFNPASIFMGDTGSMFLGFVLAAAAIQTHQKSSTAVVLIAPVVALGLPIGDTLLAMLRRALRGRPMFQADREHIHHLLLAKGWSTRQACLALYAVAALLGAAGVTLARMASSWGAILLLASLVAAGAVFLRWLGYARLERLPEVAELRRRNLQMRAGVRSALEDLRRAETPRQVWEALRGVAPVLGASGVAVTLVERTPRGLRPLKYAQGFDEAGGDLLRARFPYLHEDDAALELGFADGRAHVDRDTEIAIEQLCLQLARTVEQLCSPQAARAERRAVPFPLQVLAEGEEAAALRQVRRGG